MSDLNRFSGGSDGNVYYIRLKTPAGVFYKLDYTSASSVYDRFSFNGSNDADCIDKIILFTPLNDAFQVEQKLHSIHTPDRSFGKYSAIDGLSLFKNGQSELYHKDILGLDPDSSKWKSLVERFNTFNFHEKVVKGSHPVLMILAYPAAIALAIGVLIMLAVTYPMIWFLEREDENDRSNDNSSALRAAREERFIVERIEIIKRLVSENKANTKLRRIE